ncbi:hypothetical protein L0666_00830 [Octadecabacter sp. CECT 8868]|uniref:hypothetical protein n=1 Tax=Octadecabacter algicola TaxID=2909342 RepID=UPI001F376058|nr:hypothetical protein [Octadecabacter algicola]MCF2903519.1 hypothetical protein [Octadecabacter algicola]
MKFLFAVFITCFGFVGTAQACPDYTLWGNEVYNSTGGQLFSPRQFNVVAGGDNNLQRCGFASGVDGFVITEPDFSFDLSGMNGYRIVIDVKSNCDSVLLANTADTQWYYDDDSNGNADPRLDIGNPGNGVLDVWVGTFDGQTCNAVLTLETFN